MTVFLSFIKPMIVLSFTIFLIVVSLVYAKKTESVSTNARNYDFKLPFLIPVGLFLTDNLVLRFYNPNSNARLRNMISNLFGHSSAEYFLQVHIVQKAVLATAILFISAVFSLLIAVDYIFVLFVVILVILTLVWTDRSLDFKLEKRNQNILIELPEFINKTALLVNAGLSFNAAINKIVSEKADSGVLYRELNHLVMEINNGKAIRKAYEDFALRYRIPEVTRFVSSVLQNINRGSNDLVFALRLIAQESWEKRKDVARKQGEEASSKLVFPMVMIFIAVAIIVLAPAVMTMSM